MKKYTILVLCIFILSGLLSSQEIVVTSPTGGTYTPGSSIPITWTTRGISSGHLRITLVKEDKSFRRTIEPYLIYNATPSISYTIPDDISTGCSYFIKIRWVEGETADRSGTFIIVPPARPAGIQIHLPAASQKFALGNPVLIEWTMPEASECGDRVSIYAKRMATGDEYAIAENYSCRPNARNTYSWTGSTPFYYDIRGDYRIKIRSSRGCTRESETFQLLSRDEYNAATAVGSDFSIESVTFSDGRSLNSGMGFAPGVNLTNTFSVTIKWNRSRPPRKGNHMVAALSVLTNEPIQTSNNPASFSYDDANASSGIIRINVPFNIPAGKVLSMKRGRFIPILFKLKINPAGCDAIPRNNNKEFKMRVTEGVRSADFVVEIMSDTIRTSVKKRPFRKGFDWGIVSFNIRYKNIGRTDAGGPAADINNVQLKYKWKPLGVGRFNAGMFTDETITVPVVSSRWNVKKVHKKFSMRSNIWADFRLETWIDPNKQFIDPDRDNNYAEDTFNFTE